MRDDKKHTAAATRLIEKRCTEEAPGVCFPTGVGGAVPGAVRGYGYRKPVLLSVFTKLLGAVELRVETPGDAWTALRAYQDGPVEFADYLIVLRGRANCCETIATFDKKAAQSGLHTLVVS